MSVSNRHSIYAVRLDDTVDVILKAIGSVNLRTETQYRGDVTSGAVYREHQAIVGQAPTGDFTTMALAQAIDNIWLTGLSIGSLASGFDFFAYKHQEGGSRATGTSHRQYRFTEGLIVPRRLSVEHQGDAELTYDVLPTYDGTNDIVQVSDSVAVPSVPSDDERFTIHSVSLGGVTISGVKSIEIDFGINVEREGADSDLWPTHASIVSINPVLTIRGITMDWLSSSNIPLIGKSGTHANSVIKLRKRLQTQAGFVADGTSEHISITGNGLAYIDDAYASQGDSPNEVSIVMPMRYDGSNAPLVVDTTATLS